MFRISRYSEVEGLGKMVGILFEIIDLPEPGGPISIILWDPATATSTALLRFDCPLTSLKSGAPNGGSVRTKELSLAVRLEGFAGDSKNATASARLCTGKTFISSTKHASSAASGGTSKPFLPIFRASIASVRPPLISRTSPDRPSSPAIR